MSWLPSDTGPYSERDIEWAARIYHSILDGEKGRLVDWALANRIENETKDICLILLRQRVKKIDHEVEIFGIPRKASK